MKKKTTVIHDFNYKLHIIGRIWISISLAIFILIPIILCLYFGEKPDWKIFGTAAVIVPFIINFGSGILEPIIYAPMLGTNGEYLAFITGNLSNLKIPCVVKAQEIAGTKLGTEENELVSTIAVAASTLVTVLIIAIFVLALSFTNLQTVIEKNTFITPAFSCVVYALFGSIGGKYIAKNPKLAIFPAIVIAILSAVLGFLKVNVGSAYLIVGIAIALIFGVSQFFIQKKKAKRQAEIEHLQELAGKTNEESINDGVVEEVKEETVEENIEK